MSIKNFQMNGLIQHMDAPSIGLLERPSHFLSTFEQDKIMVSTEILRTILLVCPLLYHLPSVTESFTEDFFMT